MFKTNFHLNFDMEDEQRNENKAIENGENIFKCETCDKIFKRQMYLNQHISRMHKKESGVEIHKCDTCTKNFSNSKTLAKH